MVDLNCFLEAEAVYPVFDVIKTMIMLKNLRKAIGVLLGITTGELSQYRGIIDKAWAKS